jgi:glycosyltransferase involved in cell wall biosynthesis
MKVITDISNSEGCQRVRSSKAMLMMSTLVIQPLAPVYGTPIVAHTLRAYLKAGWTVYLVVGFKPDPVDDELVKQLHISWFAIPLLRTLGRLRKIGFFARAVWWAIAQVLFFAKGFHIISKHKVDLIYTWDVDAAPAAWMLSKLFGIPWVARYLGSFLYNQMKNVAWKVRCWQQVLAYKLPADLIIMTDDGTLGDVVLEKLGVDRDKIRFWMNGVDKQAFSALPPKEIARQSLGITTKYVLLAVSRLDNWKRVDRIISAMPGVISKIPETTLVVIGDGPERHALQKLARELGVAGHVRFFGSVRHEEVPLYYAAADVFVSLYDVSNVGNPLLEAMVAGKCCVALDVGGTSKIVKHGVTGILITKEQLDFLDQVLVSLLENQPLRERLGVNAREWAWQHLKTWDERLEQELLEVEKLLSAELPHKAWHRKSWSQRSGMANDAEDHSG